MAGHFRFHHTLSKMYFKNNEPLMCVDSGLDRFLYVVALAFFQLKINEFSALKQVDPTRNSTNTRCN